MEMTEKAIWYGHGRNVTRTTLGSLALYRAALTLDAFHENDNRQRARVQAFAADIKNRFISNLCMNYQRPSKARIARLLLELLKHLEGDETRIITKFRQALIQAKMNVEPMGLDDEPDLDAILNGPSVMLGDPQTTFPRILALVWLTLTDQTSMKQWGWCPMNKINEYLRATRPPQIARSMETIEPTLARARHIMEDFIQSINPLNIVNDRTAPVGALLQYTLNPDKYSRKTLPADTTTVHKKWTPVDEVEAVHALALVTTDNIPVVLMREPSGAVKMESFLLCTIGCFVLRWV